jgi:hypothetical protein
MHPFIREKAAAMGFFESDTEPSSSTTNTKGKLIILPYGAQDLPSITSTLSTHNITQIPTILAILTFCSIPSPSLVLPKLLTHLLKPGGKLLYYEHVQSPISDVAFWQRMWTPIWRRLFDGCRLDVPTHLIIDEMMDSDGEKEFWGEKRVWRKEGESETSLFTHRVGCYTRSLRG